MDDHVDLLSQIGSDLYFMQISAATVNLFVSQTEAAAAMAGVSYPWRLWRASHPQCPRQDLHRQQQQPRTLPAGKPVLWQPCGGKVLREERPPPGLCGLWERTVWPGADQCEDESLFWPLTMCLKVLPLTAFAIVFIKFFSWTSGLQWELPVQEPFSLFGPSQRPRAVG